MASSLAGALGPVAGFAIYEGFGYPGVFMGAGLLLIVSFFLGFMVPEPKLILSDGKIGHWSEAVAVRETLLPAVVVSLLAFGQGGTLTFLPIHALKLGIENPGLWFGLYAGCAAPTPNPPTTAAGRNNPGRITARLLMRSACLWAPADNHSPNISAFMI